MNGRIIEACYPEPVPGDLKLDISGFPAGIYFIRVTVNDELRVGKVVKH